jgi:DNA integrity scanning protein DisA with diadenylate cyclase activity
MYIGGNPPIPEVTGAPATRSPVAACIQNALLQCAAQTARHCGAAAVFIYHDEDLRPVLQLPDDGPRVIQVVRRRPTGADAEPATPSQVCIPGVPLSRIGQVKIAVVLALARQMVKPGDIVVCVSGPPHSGVLDTVIVTQVGRELESLPFDPRDADHGIRPEVLDRVLQLASELGCEGREGRAVGTLFVVGDHRRVEALSGQLILNPFQGYPPEQRNILDPRLEETVKELSTLDGAFIVSGEGTLIAAGAMLKTSTTDDHGLPQGLGARHHAAAGITAATNAIALAVSQSTGSVTLFRRGRIIAQIDKPHSHPRPRWLV